MTTPDPAPPLPASLLRMALRLGAVAVVVWVGLQGLDWLHETTDSPAFNMTALGLILLVYALLLAVPFMPGIEIGFTLLMMRGAEAAPFVWAATVLGLMLAYLAGQWFSLRWITGLLRDLRMTGTADMIARLNDLPSDQRLRFLCQRAPGWLTPVIRDWRYLALALLVNLPGNVVIGGGGGLALLAGFSRIFAVAATLLTFVLCTAPLPVLVWFFGVHVLPWTN
ncbi:hypothetical protein [Puniceibacterium sp. IMCC21224]|uniref:hypothetical protein n=1 Tax=Puniceibacterium sp. IMCC21224 TaxID=1618204 RepID=UPI00064DA5E5|nr:hypothetical protein [Puniceibacterium sp. IMCC21224]KMK67136.1 hypothetical protein IMCC21224_112000 [Puniceibacterium sp. IMCC21224]